MAEAARMDVALQESVNRTYAKAYQIRPKNTQRAYNGRQQEFLDWCSAKGSAFNDLTRTTVTGEKLHLFLEECVIGRSKRHKSGNTSIERPNTVGRSTVNSYVAAMVDLWKQQARARINSYPSPRNEAVKALLQVTQYEEDARKRKNYEDRGAGTMLDGYTTTDQLRSISRFFWNNFREPGVRLRNLLAFLLSHYALMRGEASRKMELADIHCVKLENEGYSPCRAVVMVMRQGKTNQVGRIEVGSYLRNKCVELCPHGLLAFYLFWRWHVDREPFPDFTSSERWYPLKLFKTGKDATVEMSYKVHRDAMADALKCVGINSKAKNHVGRGSGARMADLAGASEAQIRRLGRWNNEVTEKCYLTSLPREAMRTLAGFEPAKGSYFLARAHADPPLGLQEKVFPQIQGWQTSLNAGECEQTIAAGGFLELLQYLRVVLLQDAVFMIDWMPSHPMWQHPLFCSSEFQQYRQESKRVVSEMDDPSEQQLQKAMPILQAKVDGVHHDLKASILEMNSSLQTIQGDLKAVIQTMAPLSRGTAVLQVKLVPDGSSMSASAPVAPAVPDESPACEAGETRAITRYTMSRSLVSVHDLWNEWSVGLNGGPAVSVLEEKYGTKWCGSDERRFFNRRRRVIALVQELSSQLVHSEKVTESAAAKQIIDSLDSARKSQKKSLNWMSKNPDVFRDIARRALSTRPLDPSIQNREV
jgi:hypothetical protein